MTGLLRYAVLALGAERGFLVTTARSGRRKPYVLKAFSLRFDRRSRPSMTAVRASLRKGGTQVWVDVPEIDRLNGAHSIRSMKLRNVMFAPVRSLDGSRISLLFDTRSEVAGEKRELGKMLDAFAALFNLCMCRDRASYNVIPARNRDGTNGDGLVGEAPVFLNLLAMTRKFANCDLPVLIQGESGTGKEGISRLIHANSGRREKAFMAINCSAFPETLMESELFGAMRGAYTGAIRDSPGLFRLADGGTLLLDEIGDMPAAMQAKLLRVLQEGKIRPIGGDVEQPVNVRILSASHRNLMEMVHRRKFRHDLYWRLACLRLSVPPLRDRMEDLPILVRHITGKLSGSNEGQSIDLSEEAIEKLESYNWPGNVRELESVLARAMMHAAGPVILPSDLLLESHGVIPGPPVRTGETMEEAMIRTALSSCGRNVTAAAARIGWTRQKLYRRMRHFGISR